MSNVNRMAGDPSKEFGHRANPYSFGSKEYKEFEADIVDGRRNPVTGQPYVITETPPTRAWVVYRQYDSYGLSEPLRVILDPAVAAVVFATLADADGDLRIVQVPIGANPAPADPATPLEIDLLRKQLGGAE